MSEKKYLSLNDVRAYRRAFNLSNFVWEVVLRWQTFARQTVGRQFVTSIDSISANVAEGFGRYHKRDRIRFYRYSYGSLKEGLDWNEKSRVRGLISSEEYQHIYEQLSRIQVEINSLIKFTEKRLKV